LLQAFGWILEALREERFKLTVGSVTCRQQLRCGIEMVLGEGDDFEWHGSSLRFDHLQRSELHG
jgi:hypothetical protein